MRESMSIWFFAGILLLAYGVVIFTTGIWELSHPLAQSAGSEQSSCADLVGCNAHSCRPGLHHRLSPAPDS